MHRLISAAGSVNRPTTYTLPDGERVRAEATIPGTLRALERAGQPVDDLPLFVSPTALASGRPRIEEDAARRDPRHRHRPARPPPRHPARRPPMPRLPRGQLCHRPDQAQPLDPLGGGVVPASKPGLVCIYLAQRKRIQNGARAGPLSPLDEPRVRPPPSLAPGHSPQRSL
jgi:hypothetical protein